jgi:ketosteroid isomerase-like protein
MTKLEDELAIRSLADRYTDAVNHRDWDAYAACWTQDGVWDLGPPVNQRKEGLPAILEEVTRAVGGMDLFIQMTHAITVLEVQGDRALARATLNEIGRIKPENRDLLGGAEGMFILAIYTDELRRVDGGWRYAKRTYQVALFDGRAPEGLVQPIADLRRQPAAA